MAIELDKLIPLAEKRLVSIPRMIGEDDIYVPQTEEKTELMRVMASAFIKSIDVKGFPNLYKGLDILNYTSLTVVGNHLTDLDHAARRMGFEKVRCREFADRIVYPSGLKMRERSYIHVFMAAEQAVYVPTPADFAIVKEALANDNLIDYERQTLESYLEKLNDLRFASRDKLAELRKEGNAVGLYPESTRSRYRKIEGREKEGVVLEDAPKDVSGSFGREGYIMSVVVVGHEEALPAERWPKPQRRSRTRMIVGEPYPATLVWEWWRRGRKMGEDRNPAEYVMAKIAEVTPSRYLDPQKLPRYQQILSER